MRGKFSTQVDVLWSKSGINQTGHSKHLAKQSARESGAKNWHEIGKQTGIHSFKTGDDYTQVWKQVAEHAKENFNVKDMQKLEGKHVAEFLKDKVDQKIAHATFQKYSAACEKLETALNGLSEKWGQNKTYNFSQEIKGIRGVAKQSNLQKFESHRRYQAPAELIKNIEGSKFQLAAKIQYESGARVSGANKITEKRLKGMGVDPVTKEAKGQIWTKEKGGKQGMKYVSEQTYKEICKEVKEGNGVFHFKENEYREALKSASIKTDQKYNGTHGLRWNYATERFSKIQKGDIGRSEALSIVSAELFHHRADITEHYLKT